MERQPDIYLNVQVDQIVLGTNIRGPYVGDTTDLQESIRVRGVEEPLWVRPGDEDGTFVLIDGRRRLTACRAIDYVIIPVLLKDVTEDEAIDLMLTVDMREKQPAIVLDKEGQVVGGLCWAFYRQVSAGKQMKDITAARGIRADVVGAYVALHDDLIEMRRLVASGRLAITVYSLVKHASPEFKRYLLTRKTLSARAVRKELKEWPVTEARLKREAEIDQALEDIPEEEKAAVRKQLEQEHKDPVHADIPTAAYLNQITMHLEIIRDREFEPTDIHLLLRAYDVIRPMMIDIAGLDGYEL